jgi:hypothetical protein
MWIPFIVRLLSLHIDCVDTGEPLSIFEQLSDIIVSLHYNDLHSIL